jgi:hypothetical protein
MLFTAAWIVGKSSGTIVVRARAGTVAASKSQIARKYVRTRLRPAGRRR